MVLRSLSQMQSWLELYLSIRPQRVYEEGPILSLCLRLMTNIRLSLQLLPTRDATTDCRAIRPIVSGRAFLVVNPPSRVQLNPGYIHLPSLYPLHLFNTIHPSIFVFLLLPLSPLPHFRKLHLRYPLFYCYSFCLDSALLASLLLGPQLTSLRTRR